MASHGRPTRRHILATTGAGLAAGLAGCTGGGGGGGDTPEDTPTDGGDPPMETATPSEYVQPGDTGEEVHILTDYSNDNWQKLWEDTLTPEFESALGVELEAEYVGFQGSGEQRLTTLIQSGDAPESFTGGITQVGDMLAQGQMARVTHVVDYLIENNGSLLGEADTVLGEHYVVPHGKYVWSWHYRTDIMEDIGADIPTTLEAVLDVARTIDEDDSIRARGVTVPAPKAGQSSAFFDSMLWAQGASFYEWEDQDAGIARVWFPEKESVAALEYAKELSQYSPDPTSVNWGSWLSFWAGNRIAMGYHLNAWGAGVAAEADNVEIAENTDIRPLPTKEGVEPFAQGDPGFDGHPAIGISGNVPGWLSILRYMYEDPNRAARLYLTEPTRFLPAYTPIMDTDAYTNAEIFRQVPHLLELNRYCRETIAPLDPTGEYIAQTPATIYAERFPIMSELMNEVLVAERDPTAAYREAHDRLETRLAEGQKLVDENF